MKSTESYIEFRTPKKISDQYNCINIDRILDTYLDSGVFMGISTSLITLAFVCYSHIEVRIIEIMFEVTSSVKINTYFLI